MSQSLYTAMGGISSATTQLSVISNNVANINTTAFKSSSVQFSDVYSTTLSYGSVATSTSGGTNPIQVGVGTEVSAISTDFGTGSWCATGKNTDLMVNGSGFFSVAATDGTTYYTRAGNFSIDENGNLVTTDGYKVLGTNTNLSTHSSDTTVKIPTAITAVVAGTDLVTAGSVKKVIELNSTKSVISNGNFQLAINGGAATTINVNADSTVDNMITDINAQLTAAGAPFSNVTASATTDGTICFKDTTETDILTFTTPTSNASNFLTQTGIVGTSSSVNTATVTAANLAALTNGTFTVTNSAGAVYNVSLAANPYASADTMVSAINSQLAGSTITAAVDPNGGIEFKSSTSNDNLTLGAGTSNFYATFSGGLTRNYTSNVLDQSVHITDLTSKSTSANSETINNDGSLEVTYKDGSTLSVEPLTDGTYSFVFTTSDSIKINGADCVVDPSVAVPANFVIQMATVTNTEGLLSVGNNLYAAGPNTGDIVYTVAGEMGCGKVASGGLEASNVDLSEELSNMILAQRAIQANSRVFTTTANIMDTITNMGR